MKFEHFLGLMIAFVLFIGSIVAFKFLDLDVNFIITFILAMFSIGISIYFFTESSKFFGLMREKLIVIQEGVKNLNTNKDKVEDLNISDTYKYKVKRGTKK
jgi:hypothetical protein